MARPLQFRRRSTPLPLLLLIPSLLPIACAAPLALWFSLVLSPLQKQYFPAYMVMNLTGELAGKRARPSSVWWIWKTGPKHKPELASDADIISAPKTGPKSVPLALSPEAQAKGWTGILRAKQIGGSSGEKAVLQEQFFSGESFTRMLLTPFCGMALLALVFLGLRGRFGRQAAHEERHGRRTKGPELTSALGRVRGGKSDGICFRRAGRLGLRGAGFQIPRRLESSHILLMGDTGSRKSNAIRQILRQVQKRGESAIVYDPAGEFVQEFCRPERGDYILNPLDARCSFWDLNGELDSRGIEDAIAAAMLPEKHFEKGFRCTAPGACRVAQKRWLGGEPFSVDVRPG